MNLGNAQDHLLSGVAKDDGHLRPLDLFNPVVVQLDDDEGNPEAVKNLGDLEADPSPSGDDDMVMEPRTGDVGGLQGLVVEPSLPEGVESPRQPGNRVGDHHGENGGGEDERVEAEVDGLRRKADPAEDEGELPDLKEP